jgi:hypothetical protein
MPFSTAPLVSLPSPSITAARSGHIDALADAELMAIIAAADSKWRQLRRSLPALPAGVIARLFEGPFG